MSDDPYVRSSPLDDGAGMTPADPSAVTVRGLVVVRGGRTVLQKLTFSVPRGAITGLLGPSGCGKTTLMRSIVGVQRVRTGTVTVLGTRAGHASLRHRVGYVTQSPSIYGDMSIRDNLRYFGSLYNVDTAAIEQTLANVGLTEHAHQLAGTLSGGQHARASLACALVAQPELLILDEPTVGLDPVLRNELWARFHRLAAAGTTLMISSHVMDEARRCHQLLLMREGTFIAKDTPAALREHTGTDDLEQAFLHLIETRTKSADSPGGQSRKEAR